MKKLKDSFAGVLVGLGLLVAGSALLWWNEGNNVRNLKTTKEASKEYIDVTSEKVDKQNEGKLVATNGAVVLSGEAVDSVFGIKFNTAHLVRTVEMFQWKEESHTDDNDKTTYSYKKVWSSSLIDSSEFKEGGHSNPANMTYKSDEFLAPQVNVGAFVLSKGQVRRMSASRELPLFDEKPARNLTISGDYMTSTKDEGDPQIGDIRVSWSFNDWEEASILARQKGNSFEDFVSKSNKTINRVEKGILSGQQILEEIKNENKFLKWFFRLVGLLVVFGGYYLIIGPLTTLTSFVPFLGTLVGGLLGTVAFLVAFVHSLVLVAIAWLRFRPIFACVLLVVAVALIIVIRRMTKKAKAEKTDAAVKA